MALTLAVLGVPDSAIVDDYAESDSAYRDLNDRQAMVGALAQVRPRLSLIALSHAPGLHTPAGISCVLASLHGPLDARMGCI